MCNSPTAAALSSGRFDAPLDPLAPETPAPGSPERICCPDSVWARTARPGRWGPSWSWTPDIPAGIWGKSAGMFWRTWCPSAWRLSPKTAAPRPVASARVFWHPWDSAEQNSVRSDWPPVRVWVPLRSLTHSSPKYTNPKQTTKLKPKQPKKQESFYRNISNVYKSLSENKTSRVARFRALPRSADDWINAAH